MHLKFKHIYLIFFINLFSAVCDATFIISLGGSCIPTTVLRELKLRKHAYPFDWKFTPFTALYKSFEENFARFLEPSTLKVGTDKRSVVDVYGNIFVHDFPTITHAAAIQESEEHQWAEIRPDWKNYIAAIREKYQRRIERLRNALRSDDLVLLIRHVVTKDEAFQLRDLLIQLYPKLNFVLIAVNNINNATQIENWKSNHLINFYIRDVAPGFWDDWRNIFSYFNVSTAAVKDKLTDICCTCDETYGLDNSIINCRIKF